MAPLPVEEFLRCHWRGQRAVYIPSPPSKIAGFYSLAAHHEAIAEIRPAHLRASYSDGSPERAGLSAEEALEHFSRGATICVTSLHAADPVLAELCGILNRQLLSPDRIYVNSYYSPVGQGFDLHYDPQSVWILQIEGRKRWRFSSHPEIEYPQQGTTGVEHATHGGIVPEAGDLECVDLSPGDVLYLPPGTWHRGEALDGSSLALSLSQPHEATLPILTRALATQFQSVEWHRHFPTAMEGAAAIEAHLAHALAAMRSITLEHLRDAWSTLAIAPGESEPAGEGRTVRIPHAFLAFDRGDALLIYARGKRYTLPAVCRALFDTLSREKEIDRAQAVALLEGDGELLADLVQIGAVV